MKNIILSSFFIYLFSSCLFAETLNGNFTLKSSTIDYTVKYLIKKAAGTSIAAKGKGECSSTQCQFLIAAPIKSFISKDSGRDTNMLKTTKADKYPLVVVKVTTKNEITKGELLADFEVEFAGVKQNYSNLNFKATPSETGFKVSGTFDLLLDNHKVEKPSLLMVEIDNLVPIVIEAEFQKVN